MRDLGARLIFVVGARRSGTNWLQRVLAAHPDVAAVPGETYLFSHGIAPLLDRFHHGPAGSPSVGTTYVDPQHLLGAVRHLCDTVFADVLRRVGTGETRLVERTPEHARHLGVIGTVYPDARVVHIVRDGRDVARSLVAQPWGPRTIRAAAEEWRSAVRAARAAGSDFPHYVEVRYEDLLADPAEIVEQMYARLDLAATPDAVAAGVATTHVPVNVDPTQPQITPAKWRTTLRRRQVAACEAVAGDLLRELAYPPADGAAGGVPRVATARAVRRTRRLVHTAKRFLGRASQANAAFEREALTRLERGQAVADSFLSAIHTNRIDVARRLAAGDILVRVVGPEGRIEERGEAGFRLLEREVMADPALSAPQRHGDVHPAVPTYLVVAAYEFPAGNLSHRVMAFTVFGSAVAEVMVYRLDQPP